MKLNRRQFLAAAALLFAGCAAPEGASGTFAQTGDGFFSGGVRFPLKEKLSYTFYVSADALNLQFNGGQPGSSPFWQELERRTNVHFDFVCAPLGMDSDSYLEQLLHHYVPDIIMGSHSYGRISVGKDQPALSLEGLLPAAAPEYCEALAAAGRADETDRCDGWLYTVSSSQPVPYAGFVMRGDWLDELGLAVPETYDEWETVLTAFKEKKGCASPLAITRDVYRTLGVGCGYICDAGGTSYYMEGSRLQHALLARPDACKAFLQRLNRWYEKGLLGQECLTFAGFSPDAHYLNTGTAGAGFAMYSELGSRYAPVAEQGGRLVGVPWPVEKKGQAIRFNPALQKEPAYPAVRISAGCPQPEVLLALFNYLFTRPGFLLANYGLQGEQYTLDAAGEPHFMPHINEGNVAGVLRRYTLPPGWGPALVDQQRQLGVCAENARQAVQAWQTGVDEMPPELDMDAAQAVAYRELYDAVRSRIDEVCEQLVIGSMSFEKWGSFLAELNEMGLPQCVSLLRQNLKNG